MVKLCQVCKKLDYLNSVLSFHRFPVNIERRNVWYSLLGFECEKVLPKYAYICSEHFNRDNFMYKHNGVKYLKTDANPKPLQPHIFQESISSSSSIVFSVEDSHHNEGLPSSENESVGKLSTASILQNSPASKRYAYKD